MASLKESIHKSESCLGMAESCSMMFLRNSSAGSSLPLCFWKILLYTSIRRNASFFALAATSGDCGAAIIAPLSDNETVPLLVSVIKPYAFSQDNFFVKELLLGELSKIRE